jgi:uncharacterized protein (TIGR00290 family)
VTRTGAVLSWSGGKDSALALQAVQLQRELEIVGLITTTTANYNRISMHGVRTELLHAQQRSLDLPLFEIAIPPLCSNQDYEIALHKLLAQLCADGVRDVVFGDLFLEDIRTYRETQLSKVAMSCHFPVWGSDTRELAHYFIEQGFRAVLVCVDPKQLDAKFCGREFDTQLLADLPPSCDPCGERGEFHTFVYEGPIFKEKIAITHGEIVERDGFVFCDLKG